MKPSAKQVEIRCALLLAGYAAWGALAFLLGLFRGQSGVSVYQADPRPVERILVGLAGALAVATASVVWRVARHSARVGVAGMTVAVLTAVTALAGMLSVGLFIVPIAVVLFFLALPITPEHSGHSGRIGPPPAGWYADPADEHAWRFWDGHGRNGCSPARPRTMPDGPAKVWSMLACPSSVVEQPLSACSRTRSTCPRTPGRGPLWRGAVQGFGEEPASSLPGAVGIKATEVTTAPQASRRSSR